MTERFCMREDTTFISHAYIEYPTRLDTIVDIVLGFFLPILCLIMDPVVFRDGFDSPADGPFSGGLLRNGLPFCRTAISIGLFTLSLWLWSRYSPAMFAGLLFGGALFAFCLGCILFPLSLFGTLLLGIGLLGLSPFATAWVFWRNALYAFRKSREAVSRFQTWSLLIVGLVISLGIPVAVQFGCGLGTPWHGIGILRGKMPLHVPIGMDHFMMQTLVQK